MRILVKKYASTAFMLWALWLTMFILSPAALAAEAHLVILHTNDLHSRVVNTDDRNETIGLPEMTAAVKKIKRENKNALWLDAGDTFHGMPRINVSKGENMVLLLNKAGVNAMAPGNHDFNYGTDQLLRLSKATKFPVLAANVSYKDSGELLFAPYKIFNLSGVTVGVFGLGTPDTKYAVLPSHVAKINFADVVPAAKAMVEELRPKCDVVIALTHVGLNKQSLANTEDLAKQVPGIDVIIDGHSHTTLPHGLTVNGILIAQTGCHGYNLGRVDIDVQDGKVISKEAKLLSKEDVKHLAPAPDKDVAELLTKIEKRNEELFAGKVGESKLALPAKREFLRREETVIGDFCADAVRWRTKADIAVINGGSIRSDIPQGTVTEGDLMKIFPFGNSVQTIEAQGITVRQMVEHSVSFYPHEFGGFLHVSGMTFTFDPTKLAGSRVQEIMFNGSPLDDNLLYNLAASDFLFQGGDGYDMLKDHRIIGTYENFNDVLGDYLRQNENSTDIKMGRAKRLKDIPWQEVGETPKAA